MKVAEDEDVVTMHMKYNNEKWHWQQFTVARDRLGDAEWQQRVNQAFEHLRVDFDQKHTQPPPYAWKRSAGA